MSVLKINLKALVISLGFSFLPILIWLVGFNYAFQKSGWGLSRWSILLLILGSFISFKIYNKIKGIF